MAPRKTEGKTLNGCERQGSPVSFVRHPWWLALALGVALPAGWWHELTTAFHGQDVAAAGLLAALIAIWWLGHSTVSASTPTQGAKFTGIGLMVSITVGLWFWPRDTFGEHLIGRPDLALAAPWTASAVLIVGGWSWLRSCLGPLLLLVAAWPPVLEFLSEGGSGLMSAWVRFAGPSLAAVWGTDITPVPEMPGLFWCRGTAGIQPVTLGPACTGMVGVVVVALLAIPVWCVCRPTWWRGALWFLLGSVILILATPLRFAVLATAAAAWGNHNSGFVVLHASAGTIILIMVWGIMLLSARPLGLRPPARPAAAVRIGWWPVVIVMMGAGALCVADLRFARFETPSGHRAAPSRISVIRAENMLPALSGFTRWPYRSLPWAMESFGPGSRFERMVYQADGETRLRWVDVVVAREAEAFVEHSLEGCFRWHGYTVEETSTGEIAPGVPAHIHTLMDDRKRRWVVASAVQEVLAEDGPAWRRITVQIRDRHDQAASAARNLLALLMSTEVMLGQTQRHEP